MTSRMGAGCRAELCNDVYHFNHRNLLTYGLDGQHQDVDRTPWKSRSE